MRHVAKLSHARWVITADNDTERDAGNAWSIHSFTYPQIEKWTSLGYV
jgi:hypothetical protein